MVAHIWKQELVEDDVDRRRKFVYGVEESVAESGLELSPALFEKLSSGKSAGNATKAGSSRATRSMIADAWKYGALSSTMI